MLLFAVLIVIIGIMIYLKEDRWIAYGQLQDKYHVTRNGHEYYVEEVKFKKYNEALSKYFKVVESITHYGETIDSRYDLYDWGYSTFQFKDTLIDVRYFRSTHSIRLIKSLKPLSIAEYEKDKLGYEMDIK